MRITLSSEGNKEGWCLKIYLGKGDLTKRNQERLIKKIPEIFKEVKEMYIVEKLVHKFMKEQDIDPATLKKRTPERNIQDDVSEES